LIRPAPLGAALLLAAACSRDSRPPSPPPPVPGASAHPAGESYVTASAALKREPSDQPRVKAEGAKAPVPNSIALLQRGERVTSLDHRADYTRVRASDGTEGWVKSSVLLAADDVSEATVLSQAWAFDRPDLLAVNVKRKVEPGTLLLVVKTKELFSEVDLGQGQNAWVLSDRISTQPADVMAAKLVEKARSLLRSGHPDEAKEVLGLLRARQPDSPFVAFLAADLGEGPATDGGAPDAGAPSPAGPPR